MLSIKTILLLFSTLCVSSLLYVLTRAATTPLRSVPGPFFARFNRFWYARELHRGAFQKTSVDLHRKYGR